MNEQMRSLSRNVNYEKEPNANSRKSTLYK